MRKSMICFNCLHPNQRYRHEKPDIKSLLERRDEEYVDVGCATWLAALCQENT